MNQLSVFRSNNAARWIDMDPIEVEPDPAHEPRPAELQGSARELPARPLRHRPFERLAGLALDRRST